MGIGELNEGPLHSALKAAYAANGGDAEVAIDGFVADAVRGGVIYEIQTGSFSGLRRKLGHLVRDSRLVLVHPIARNSYIVKVGEGGEIVDRRLSPKHGELAHIVSELVYLPELLMEDNFAVEAVLVDQEEIRVFDAKKRRRRGGWRVRERRLLTILDSVRIASGRDLLEFLNSDLPLPFTTRDLGDALSQPRHIAQQFAYCLRHSETAELCGKQGNALEYRLVLED